jgi:hypothetical protein
LPLASVVVATPEQAAKKTIIQRPAIHMSNERIRFNKDFFIYLFPRCDPVFASTLFIDDYTILFWGTLCCMAHFACELNHFILV